MSAFLLVLRWFISFQWFKWVGLLLLVSVKLLIEGRVKPDGTNNFYISVEIFVVNVMKGISIISKKGLLLVSRLQVSPNTVVGCSHASSMYLNLKLPIRFRWKLIFITIKVIGIIKRWKIFNLFLEKGQSKQMILLSHMYVIDGNIVLLKYVQSKTWDETLSYNVCHAR